MKKYYDGTKLLSLMDISGNKPEIYICTSNRTAGKTTYFNRLVINRFINKSEKFCLLYRFNYELDDIENKFFKDIQNLFFNNYEMKTKKQAKGIYTELFLRKEGEEIFVSCGYAISLNSADQIKKFSHIFSDVYNIIFDEFQSETNHYCPNEIKKFISIHTSIARGNGKQVRYVPVYMISNPVSIINPYYVQLGISTRLREDTKFLKGEGFVLEQGYNESASIAQKMSAFNKAFSNNDYSIYSSEGVYLNDSQAFIEKMNGNSKYLCTVKYKNNEYAIREFTEYGVIYCDDKPDKTYSEKIVITTDDHDINFVMLRSNDLFIQQLRYYFEKGCFRFKNLICKEVILTMLSY